MGIYDAYQDWKNSRYENHVAKMREENKCPDCHGKGYLFFPGNLFMYHADSFDCAGCGGSGLYDEWNKSNQQF